MSDSAGGTRDTASCGTKALTFAALLVCFLFRECQLLNVLSAHTGQIGELSP